MRNWLCTLILFALAVGCTNSDTLPDEARNDDGAITFRTDETRMRGAIKETFGNGDNMGVFAFYLPKGTPSIDALAPNFMYNQEVTCDGSSWSYSPLKYWPNNEGDAIKFFAYAPFGKGEYTSNEELDANPDGNGITVTKNNDTGIPKLTYTVPSKCSNQPDLMVAVPVESSKQKSDASVLFSFKHALTCVGFKVAGNGETINKIAVAGVLVSGELSIDGENLSWKLNGSPSSSEYQAGIKSSLTTSTTTTDALDADGYLMMIPQTLDSDAKLIITVDGIEKEISLAGQTWTAGQKIVYNLTTGSDEITITNGGASLTWATGNLVADGANSCKIGAPTDGGLYFQFGSLIGWAGGATGDGTGRPTSTSPGYSFNSTGTVVPAGRTIPTTWGDTQRWTENKDGVVPDEYDPCRQYLGSLWRLPTSTEFHEYVNGIWGAAGWKTEGDWTYNSTNSYAYYIASPNFKLSASGYRVLSDGSLRDIGKKGYYWTSSNNIKNTKEHLSFDNNEISSSAASDPASGYPVRCVHSPAWTVTFKSNGGGTAPSAQMVIKENAITLPSGSTMTAPTDKYFAGWATSSTATSADYTAGASYTPSANITLYAVWLDNSVTITNGGITRTWAVGNLISTGANSCRIGAPTDGGLYFQFGSLIGWAGSGSGDGTGRGVSITSASIQVQPTSYTGSTTWNKNWTGSANQNASAGTGDPCIYYLGSPWRTPTRQEYIALFYGVSNTGIEGTAYTSINYWEPLGTFEYGSTTSYAIYKENNIVWLQFPASSTRKYDNTGILNQTGTCGYYWSSDVYNADDGYICVFDKDKVYLSVGFHTYRSMGLSVRCVND